MQRHWSLWHRRWRMRRRCASPERGGDAWRRQLARVADGARRRCSTAKAYDSVGHRACVVGALSRRYALPGIAGVLYGVVRTHMTSI